MGDLDDFFAKKDKKKGKTKKYLSNDELVKQLEQQPTIKEKNEVIEESQKEGAGILENDDEWASFDDSAKKVDLSNLKLGQLTLDAEEQNTTSNAERNVENEQQQTDDSENPWKKSGGAPQSTSQPEAAPVVPAKSSVYVPPGVEAAATRIRKKNMPDLQSASLFPELGTEKPLERVAKRDGFEDVRHGAAFKNVQSQQAPVSTGNQYSSLFTNDADCS